MVIPQGTHVGSKSALAQLLQAWLRETDEQSKIIGSSATVGRTPWIYVDLASARVKLNADTKREAVRDYLEDVAQRGAEVPWRVIRNSRGRVNKVLYTRAGLRLPGWYCYIVDELTTDGVI